MAPLSQRLPWSEQTVSARQVIQPSTKIQVQVQIQIQVQIRKKIQVKIQYSMESKYRYRIVSRTYIYANSSKRPLATTTMGAKVQPLDLLPNYIAGHGAKYIFANYIVEIYQIISGYRAKYCKYYQGKIYFVKYASWQRKPGTLPI